jgi:SAM-dependent methyltransferase
MSVPPPYPEALTTAVKNDKLLLFVGSGLSKSAGAPDWRTLLHELVEECGRQARTLDHEHELRALIGGEPDDLLVAADYLRRVLNVQMDNYIQQRFSPGKLKPQQVHEVIASLPVAGIITTNYDSLIEDALPPHTLQEVLPGDTYGSAHIDRSFLLKLHGTWNKPSDVVIGVADYRRTANDDALQATLRRLFQQYTVLFVGFSLRDPDTFAVLSRLQATFKGSANPHYALLEKDEAKALRRRYLEEQLNVRPLIYEATGQDHPEVCTYLEGLAEKSGRTMAMSKTLFVIKGMVLFGSGSGEPRLLVTRSNRQWSHNGEPAYMLPSVIQDHESPDFRLAASTYLGIAERDLHFEVGDELKHQKPNPVYGEKPVDYRFRYVAVSFKNPPEDLSARLTRMGDKNFEWRTLRTLRGHEATMARNGEVITNLSLHYGAQLETLHDAVMLNEVEDPYSMRASAYQQLPWVGHGETFDAILTSDALDGAKGVLDLGCGPAMLARQLRARDSKLPYVGLDASPAMIEQARGQVASLADASVEQFDFTTASRPEFDGWVFVLKNVLHLLARPYDTIEGLSARLGRPSRVIFVETESPSLASLCWIQRLFEALDQAHKRQWYVEGQVLDVLRTCDHEIISAETVDQELDIDRWVNSFELAPEAERVLSRVLESVSSEVSEEMRIEVGEQGRTMLRRQVVLHTKPA